MASATSTFYRNDNGGYGYATAAAVELQPGVTYHLSASEPPQTTDLPLTFTLEWLDPPPNDNFAERTPLTGLPASGSGTTLGASLETDEPVHGTESQPHTRSTWWTWTPSVTAYYHLTVSDAPAADSARVGSRIIATSVGASSLDAIRVYTGNLLSNLIAVATTNVADGGFLIQATAEEPLQIAVNAVYDRPRSYRLEINGVVHPANDNFADRIELTGVPVAVSAHNEFGTEESGDPPLFDAQQPRSVWWAWTAPETRDYKLTLSPANRRYSSYRYYSLERVGIGLFGGDTTTNLSLIAEGRAQYPNDSELIFSAEAGNAYPLMVVESDSDADRPCVLSITEAGTPPQNDEFENRIVLTGEAVTTTGSTVNATVAAFDRSFLRNVTGTIWWQWTSPGDGLARFTVSGPRTAIAISTGDSPHDQTSLGHSVPSTSWYYSLSSYTRVSATVSEGQVVNIMVAAIDGIVGDVGLHIKGPGEHFPVWIRTRPSHESHGFRLLIEGEPNERHVIEASGNLREWQPVFTNDSFNGAIEYLDGAAITKTRRFYRLRNYEGSTSQSATILPPRDDESSPKKIIITLPPIPAVKDASP